MKLQKQILKAGVENCMFLLPMQPLNTVFGLISYTRRSDPEIVVPARITEDRYKICDGYKITLKSDYELFGKKHFYLTDLESLIKRGTVEFYVRRTNEIF